MNAKLVALSLCAAIVLAGCSTAPEKPESKVALKAQAKSSFQKQIIRSLKHTKNTYNLSVMGNAFKRLLIPYLFL